VDEEIQVAIAWVLQRARELSPECDTAEEFLMAFGTGCDRCGKHEPQGRTLVGHALLCDDCRALRMAS